MKRRQRIILYLITDVGLACLSLPAAYLISFREMPSVAGLRGLGLVRVLLFISVVVVVSYLTETYRLRHGMALREMLARILLAFGSSFLILSLLSYSFPPVMYGGSILAVSLLVFWVLLLLSHWIYGACGKFEGFAQRVVILGTGPLAGQMGKVIPDSEGNHVLSGYVSCSNEPAHATVKNVLKPGGKLHDLVMREKAHKIVVSLSERRGVLPMQDIMKCKLDGVEVVDAPSFYEQMTGKLLLENTTPSWFIFSHGFKISATYRLIKRANDVLFAAFGLLLVMPVLPLLALVIRMDSPGPVFFRQLRVGEKEKNFFLYKFRTMREDAESGTGAVWAQEKDPRVTRVGNFLRKTRIDEIPQLFNVLKGDMSVVGPRPERPEFVEKLKKVIPYYSERHIVKPGVTGWAQVRYPYGASEEDALEKLRYDLYYIKNLSLSFDLMVGLDTVKVVLFMRGGR